MAVTFLVFGWKTYYSLLDYKYFFFLQRNRTISLVIKIETFGKNQGCLERSSIRIHPVGYVHDNDYLLLTTNIKLICTYGLFLLYRQFITTRKQTCLLLSLNTLCKNVEVTTWIKNAPLKYVLPNHSYNL